MKTGKNAAGIILADNLKGAIACAAGKTEYFATVTGLTSSTGYDVYFTAENAQAALQAIPTKVTVATASPAVPANISIAGTVAQPMCYNATNTITIAGTPNEFIVESGAQVNVIAGGNILCLPGTKVLEGGYLWGHVTTSGSWCGMTKSSSMVTTSVDAPEQASGPERSGFKVYPNPTTGDFTLQLPEIPMKSKVKAEVYGMHGERVFTADISGESKHAFSLSGLPRGIYFIRVISGEKMETCKVVKN